MRGIDPAATKGRERDASPLPANCAGDEHRETIRLNCPGSIAPVELPREAASGSAGTQPDKEYPGLRCANGASDPWKLVLPGVILISMLAGKGEASLSLPFVAAGSIPRIYRGASFSQRATP